MYWFYIHYCVTFCIADEEENILLFLGLNLLIEVIFEIIILCGQEDDDGGKIDHPFFTLDSV